MWEKHGLTKAFRYRRFTPQPGEFSGFEKLAWKFFFEKKNVWGGKTKPIEGKTWSNDSLSIATFYTPARTLIQRFMAFLKKNLIIE